MRLLLLGFAVVITADAAGNYETRDNGATSCGACTCGDTTCQKGGQFRPFRSDVTTELQCPSKDWYYCDCRAASGCTSEPCDAGQCGSCRHCIDLGCPSAGHYRRGCGFGSPGMCTKCSTCAGGMQKSGGCTGIQDTICEYTTTGQPTEKPTQAPTEAPTQNPTNSPTQLPTMACDPSNYQEQTAQAKGQYYACIEKASSAEGSVYASCKCVNEFNCAIRPFAVCSNNEGKYIAKMIHDDDCALYGPCVDIAVY